MRAAFHSRFYSDVAAVLGYYQTSAYPETVREFQTELGECLDRATARPGSFALCGRDLRRVNWRKFPYHVLFRVSGDLVKMLVLRHHKRQPSYGITRR